MKNGLKPNRPCKESLKKNIYLIFHSNDSTHHSTNSNSDENNTQRSGFFFSFISNHFHSIFNLNFSYLQCKIHVTQLQQQQQRRRHERSKKKTGRFDRVFESHYVHYVFTYRLHRYTLFAHSIDSILYKQQTDKMKTSKTKGDKRDE